MKGLRHQVALIIGIKKFRFVIIAQLLTLTYKKSAVFAFTFALYKVLQAPSTGGY